jgi:hypothetical protein
MKRILKALCLFVTLAALLAACNFPLANSQSEEDAVATSVAQTVAAVDAQSQSIVTAVVLQPTNTMPSLPTITPQTTSTIISGLPTSTPQPCNQAWMVSESPLDNASYSAGATFTKTWNLKNIGTCTWNTNYKAVFISGSAMGGPASKALTASVAPGATLALSLSLTAPSSAGTYKGVWNLQDDSGKNFANFWVQIKVGSVSEDFAVTGVSLSADDADISGTCPQTFTYYAAISTNAAGTVTYYFTYSDGSSGSTQSIVFDSEDTDTASGTWSIGTSGDYWVKIYIDSPNHQLFGPLNLTLTCTP